METKSNGTVIGMGVNKKTKSTEELEKENKKLQEENKKLQEENKKLQEEISNLRKSMPNGEKKLDEMTIPEIQKKLDELGIEYDKNAKKADLLTLLPQMNTPGQGTEGKPQE